MARNFARISTSIWEDDDWRALGPAQHVYLLILAQPKLTLAGCIDLKPKSWARMGGLTVGAVISALDTLDETEFVVIDEQTEELVVRTFTQHDNVTANGNLIRGVWSAWSAIESKMLRRCVLAHMPDKVFDEKYGPLSEPLSEPGLWRAVATGVGTSSTSTTADSCIHGTRLSGAVDNPTETLSPAALAALHELEAKAPA